MQLLPNHKQNSLRDRLKRFQFQPLGKNSKTPPHNGLIKKTKQIINDQNVDFSSVKQKQQLNQSSWISRLVNGIQQQTSVFQKQPLAQLVLAQNSSLNFKMQQKMLHHSKSLQSQFKKTERKSAPFISQPKKSNCNSRKSSICSMSAKYQPNPKDKQKQQIRDRCVGNKKQRVTECYKSQKKLTKRSNTLYNKQQTRQTHKNSLINCSSIECDKINELNKQENEKIIICLDDISLNTEIDNEIKTPYKEKKKIQTQTSKHKQIKKMQNLSQVKNQYNENNIIFNETNNKKICKNSPVIFNHKSIQKQDKPQIIKKEDKQTQKDKQSSHNQFLDTFKPIRQTQNNLMKVGTIRKNKTKNTKQQKEIGHLYKDTGKQIQIQKQNIINSQKQNTMNLFNESQVNIVKESPKFYGSFRLKQQNQNLINQRPINSTIFQRQKFILIFNKLNSSHQLRVHKMNIRQYNLRQQQKLQIGPILSKIKYLGCSYSMEEFIQQCEKINKQQKKWKVCSKNLSNHQRFLMNANNNIYTNTTWQKRLPHSKIAINDAKIQMTEQNIYIEKSINETQPLKSIRNGKEQGYVPLFPQTNQISTQRLIPNKYPYICTNIMKDSKQQISVPAYSDIGTIIDNLNCKLSTYIQTNNLQDSYKKFNLQFAQLRRNMHY